MDFNAKRRDEVFSHLYAKYKNNFAHIGTHGTLQAKNAFKDVCRIFNVPFTKANYLSGIIPDGISTISEALNDPKFKEEILKDSVLSDVIKYSEALEGTIKSYGIHACISGTQKILVKDIGLERIDSIYSDNKGLLVSVYTPNGYKDCNVIKTERKIGYKVELFTENVRAPISSLIASRDHKFRVGEKYVALSDMSYNKPYDVYMKPCVPEFVTDSFICGFILPFIIHNQISLDRYSLVRSIDDELLFLSYLYIDGVEKFKENWGNLNPQKLLFKISELSNLTINDSMIHLKKRDSIVSVNSSEFVSGLLSTLSFNRNTGLYVLPQGVNSGIFLQNFLLKFFEGIGVNLFNFSKVEFNKSEYVSLFGILPFLCLYESSIKCSLVKSHKISEMQMYDVQVITNNPNHQSYYSNGIDIHNCGVILSNTPIDEVIPLFSQNDLPVTMYDGGTCEKLNFIKVDLLGVKVLAIIDECIKLVNKNHPSLNIADVYELPLDDAKTFSMLSDGDLLGCFQLEGGSIAPYVPLCKPKSIDDIALILAIIR